MNLAIFDIDGTLIRFMPDGNNKCYLRAMRDEFGIVGMQDTWQYWTGLKGSTDSAVTEEVFQDQYRRLPKQEEIEKLKRCLATLFHREFTSTGLHFEPIAGARGVFGALRATGDWNVAIATGNWDFSARFKLESAGIDIGGVPLASADDGAERTTIIRRAIDLASGAGHTYGKIAYIGDGVWDIKAAKESGVGFVGVGSKKNREVLMQEGASIIVADFERTGEFITALESAGCSVRAPQ